MTDATEPFEFEPLDRRGLSGSLSLRVFAGAAVLSFGLSTGVVLLLDGRSAAPAAPPRALVSVALPAPAAPVRASVAPATEIPLPAPAPAPAVIANAAAPSGVLLEPLGFGPLALTRSAPLGSRFASLTAPEPMAPAPVGETAPLAAALPPPAILADVPLPAARPSGLTEQAAPGPLRTLASRPVPQSKSVLAAAPAPDTRSFIEKLFGMPQAPRAVLGYAAAPEPGLFGEGRRLSAGPSRAYDRWTAVYDIAAHTVYMPNGTQLEAHSGLGDKLDDPRHVHVQNRGATPPHVYALTPREQPFHGVRALRLTPIGGVNEIFGRTGLLAHTYMLGPRGDSNGCVSFKDYDAFLRAYLNGEVRKLVVVAGLT